MITGIFWFTSKRQIFAIMYINRVVVRTAIFFLFAFMKTRHLFTSMKPVSKRSAYMNQDGKITENK